MIELDRASFVIKERGQVGFTIIELMVSITVMAVIAVIAAPTLTNIVRTNQLKVTARDFTEHMINLRSEAVLKQREQTLTLSGTGAWVPGDKVEWAPSQPTATTLTYNMMGQMKSDNNLCFVFRHKKDAGLKAVIIARKSGMVIYDRTAGACPADLGSE